jgi:1,4-alpha-glucan branching enzyme
MRPLNPETLALIEGRHADPFRVLGPHLEDGVPVLRVFLPDVLEVFAVGDRGREISLDRIHDSGLFAGPCPDESTRYRLRVHYADAIVELEDPYRFPPVLSDFDLFLLNEGKHLQLYDKLGAQPIVHDGVPGVAFAVFAPNAQRVSVVGDFNSWDGRRHAMRVRGNGIWEIFLPGTHAGQKYKFEIIGEQGELLPLKSDPVALAAELRPKTASIIVDRQTINPPRPAPAN